MTSNGAFSSGGTSLPGTEIAFPISGDRPTARYVSSTTVHEEALEHGRLIGLYWSSVGQVQRENVTRALPGLDSLRKPIHTFELEIDGQSLHNRWDWKGASQRPGARKGTVEAVIELVHQVRPVTLSVVTRLDGTAIMARHLSITNTGKKPAALSRVCPWSGALWNTTVESFQPMVRSPRINPSFGSGGQARFSVGYFSGEHWGQEGDFVRRPLDRDTLRIERGSLGRPHGPPYYVVENGETGEICLMGLAWSGNYVADFSSEFDPLLTFRLGPHAPSPLRVIAPGETVRSPEVHLGMFHGTNDAAVAAWHAHMRASVIPRRPKGKEMYTMGARVVEEPDNWILTEVDIAAEMGVEAFMVDAGWYGDSFAGWWERRGDWNEGSWLPGGMAGIRERIHEKGMLFGLWQEPEAISPKSRLYAEHPEWTLRTDDARSCSETLDLANPDAARYVEQNVLRVIKDHKLDFYKIDYNVQVGEGGQSLRDGFEESETFRHYEVIYGLYDRVLKELPDVCLEDCAGGGGRLDLGMLSRFHYACESDWSVHPYAIRAINALSLFIPPESLCYYHNHIPHAHQVADLDTHLRVTLFALPIFVGFGAQNADRSTEYFRKTRRYIELNKTFCRKLMAEGPVVHYHTPDIGIYSPAERCVLEYASRDRTRAYAGIFHFGGAGPAYVFRPRGLDPSRTYEVRTDNDGTTFRASGRELARDGVPVLLDRPLTSELILFDAV
jgi:alpha-galactosidase